MEILYWYKIVCVCVSLFVHETLSRQLQRARDREREKAKKKSESSVQCRKSLCIGNITNQTLNVDTRATR